MHWGAVGEGIALERCIKTEIVCSEKWFSSRARLTTDPMTKSERNSRSLLALMGPSSVPEVSGRKVQSRKINDIMFDLHIDCSVQNCGSCIDWSSVSIWGWQVCIYINKEQALETIWPDVIGGSLSLLVRPCVYVWAQRLIELAHFTASQHRRSIDLRPSFMSPCIRAFMLVSDKMSRPLAALRDIIVYAYS